MPVSTKSKQSMLFTAFDVRGRGNDAFSSGASEAET
jgi:hypothetical protein